MRTQQVIRLQIKPIEGGFTCGHYTLDTERSNPEEVVWLDISKGCAFFRVLGLT